MRNFVKIKDKDNFLKYILGGKLFKSPDDRSSTTKTSTFLLNK